ncbi:probable LRR receptor-like serine/threonine-protein kinase At1g07650 [Impatiens glandulifera]|uniref:probable LRR receptor-like serine/threonine-protein kinase At1g07650 n=1 Tax=Impatiens glandulifera TaxID=253017 RepID=UPI001FB0EC66|nr:probable LRR receptor-like serine/threonine-protein kinase At1g07650 [Impatiens glandulifera]
MKLLRIYVLTVTVAICFFITVHGTAVLPTSEVETLKQIGRTLGNDNWDFSVDPCSGESGWNVSITDNAVICNCSFSNNTTCHVVSM